jgi:autotransporter-associated beta strand protein
MKRSSNLNASWSTALAGVRTAVLAVVMALAASGIAQAQTNGTWNVNDNGDWSGTGNWLDGNVAGGVGATAYFNTLDITANPTVMVNADATFGTLIVGDTTAPIKGYTFKTPTTGGPYTWTLDNGASSPVINVTTGGASLVKNASAVAFNITNGMDLIKDGPGTLSFDAITFTSPSGGLNIKQGEVVTYAGWLPQGAITMGDGTNQVTLSAMSDKGGTVDLGARAITLNAGTQTLRAGPTSYGVISGVGALSIQPPAGFSGKAWGSYFGSPESTYSGGTTIGGNGSDKVILAVGTSSTLSGGVVTKGPLGTGTVTLDGGGLAPYNPQTLHNPIVIQKDADLQDHGSPATTRNLTLAGPVTLSGGDRALTITVARTNGSGNVTISGAIGDGGNGYGLTVRSGGATEANDVLVLGAVNTYTGATVVESGILRLTHADAIASSPEIRVNGTLDVSQLGGGLIMSGAQTLGGTGTVTGDVTVQGRLAPGNSIGTLTVDNLTLANNAELVIELTSNVSAGTTYDQIDGTSLDLPGAGGTVNLTLTGVGSQSIALNDSFTLFTGEVTGFAGTTFNIVNQTDWTGGWQVSEGSLIVTAIPEPGTLMLVGMALLSLPFLRRRKA